MVASTALAMAEMPPPTRALKPTVRPHTAKQIAAVTTVTTTWPSTTLAASRLAWGNSRVTTTLLLQVDNPQTQLRAREGRRPGQRCSKIVWLGNDLRVPLARGAHYIRRPHGLQQESWRKKRYFLGRFTYSSPARLPFRATPRRSRPCSKPSLFVSPHFVASFSYAHWPRP